MIRRRAHHVDLHTPSEYDLQPGLTPDAFADSVVQERAWELAGEPEGRWFDLVRLEKVEVYIRFSPGDQVPTKDQYFFEPPEFDVNLNQGLNDE